MPHRQHPQYKPILFVQDVEIINKSGFEALIKMILIFTIIIIIIIVTTYFSTLFLFYFMQN